MVVQSHALHPPRTVDEDMACGRRIARAPKAEIDPRGRRPEQLWGVQRQRVAIGRAVARDPKVFPFDEPLSNPDAALRVATRIEIARLKERLPGTTMVRVTHDGPRRRRGPTGSSFRRAAGWSGSGLPLDLDQGPANRFVAGLIGSPATDVLGARARPGPDGPALRTAPGDELANGGLDAPTMGADRDRAPARGHRRRSTRSGRRQGRVSRLERLGEMTMAHVDAAAEPIVVKRPGDQAIERGAEASLRADMAKPHLFDPAGRSGGLGGTPVPARAVPCNRA